MLDDLPPFLTVEQAAKVLQLGRSKAYELTVEWQCSSGATGLPFVRFGIAEARPAGGAGPTDRDPRSTIHRRRETSPGGRQMLLIGESASDDCAAHLGPLAWAALEVLVAASRDEVDDVMAAATVREVAAELGVAKNTAHRAMRTLRSAGLGDANAATRRGRPLLRRRLPTHRSERRRQSSHH